MHRSDRAAIRKCLEVLRSAASATASGVEVDVQTDPLRSAIQAHSLRPRARGRGEGRTQQQVSIQCGRAPVHPVAEAGQVPA